MDKIKAAQKRVRDAFAAMEAAGDTFAEATDENRDELRTAFDATVTTHTNEVADLRRLEAIEEARKNNPVEPVEDRTPEVRVTREELTYRQGGDHSILRDLVKATMPGEIPDATAVARLQRHRTEMATEGLAPEERAINSTDGTGGELVPPKYLQDEILSIAKAGRVFADAMRSIPLPPNTDTIKLPRVTSGATVATQTDGGSVSSTDIQTGEYSFDVKTVAGQQDLSLQLYDRSVPGVVDAVVFEELAGRYAIAVDQQAIAAVRGVSGKNPVTYTDASPTVPELYPKIADGVQQIHTGRLLAPSAIVMHPRRWAFFLAASDTSNRPLVTPYAPANVPAILQNVAPQGLVGQMQGLPVLVDPNIATNGGAGTNEDSILIVRLEDLWLFEDTPVKTRVLFEVLSGTLQVRAQLYNYLAIAPGRYPKAISEISGTGLIAPTF